MRGPLEKSIRLRTLKAIRIIADRTIRVIACRSCSPASRRFYSTLCNVVPYISPCSSHPNKHTYTHSTIFLRFPFLRFIRTSVFYRLLCAAAFTRLPDKKKPPRVTLPRSLVLSLQTTYIVVAGRKEGWLDATYGPGCKIMGLRLRDSPWRSRARHSYRS